MGESMVIIIIGNGAAGNQAVDTIRKECTGARILMFSQEDLPEYSACALPDYIAGWIPRSRLFIKNSRDYQGINLFAGRTVDLIDTKHKAVISGGEGFNYDRLIIATGSRPAVPPVEGSGLKGNFVLKSVLDADRLLGHKPARVVVVGSGNIGVEIAEVLVLRGCEVVLLEVLDRVMPASFDKKPALLIKKILERGGVRVLTGERVEKVQGSSGVEQVITGRRIIPCDTVVWATGVQQNTELACAAGLKTGVTGGIKVNSHMQSSHEDIYACGDCIETFDMLTGKATRSLLWSSARKQGQIAALNCIGRKTEYEGAFNFIIEEIFGITCLAMGVSSKDGENLRLIEKQSENAYSRLLLDGDYLLGMQYVGNQVDFGPLMAAIKSRKQLSGINRVVKSPILTKMPWYLDIKKYL